MNEAGHRPWEEDLAAYALGALDDDEVAAVAATAIIVAGIAGYALRGGDGGPDDTVRVEARGAVAVLERDGDSGTLRVSDMPALRGEEVYQVWIRSGAEVQPSSAFRPD